MHKTRSPIVALLLVGSCIVWAEPGSCQAKGLAARRLRTEYRENPLGIDVRRPRLSWIVTADRRGERQTAYRILVASSPEVLAENRGDLWDSQRVASAETTAVVYAGRPLASGQQAFWKVRVWDSRQRPSAWSDPAMWSMGLLDPNDWKARWIGFDAPARQRPKEGLHLPPPRYVRTEFQLDRQVLRATLYASALGLYRLFLNGHPVGDDYFTPGWTDYDKRVYYQAYDVTDRVRRGANALGGVIADGWYAGYVGFGGQRDLYGDKIRLRAQLVVELTDGTRRIVATGPDWRASTGPLQEADFLMGERYDARREISGWDRPGFDDAAWQPVDVTTSIPAKVEAHPGPPVRALPPFKPVRITQPRKGQFVVDFGQNFAGMVRLKVRGPRGQEITLRHAERLNPDGTVYTKNLRSARATDRYVCRGGGHVESWQPRFTFHGFQYAEITGYPGTLTADDLRGIPVSSDTPVTGRFECSDPMVNKLIRNIYWTQRMNFIDIPTDCPQRDERLGWTGDAQIYIHTASLIADTQAFFTKWLVDLTDAQREDGQFPMVAPLKSKGVSADGGPAWADAGVICPWTIHEMYGDRRILERHYAAMARFIAFCKNRSTKDLLPPQRFHCFGDWLSIRADTPKEVIYEAYFAHSTRLMARIAAALGKEADAERYERLYRRIKEAFNKAYVGPDGRIKGNTQTCYVLALAFDLVDGKRREQAARYLVDDIRQRDWHLSTGFIGTKDLMLVLSKIGRTDVAYRLLHNKTFPSWGFSIEQGATTIWERWNGWTPEKGFFDPGMNSFAHYSFGAVAQWIFETVGGIQTDGPGFDRILLRPQPGGHITWAKTYYDSIHGEIVTDWKREGGRFRLRVVVPANTTATVTVPAAAGTPVREGDGPADRAEGVRPVERTDEAAVYQVGSGEYRFSSKMRSDGAE